MESPPEKFSWTTQPSIMRRIVFVPWAVSPAFCPGQVKSHSPTQNSSCFCCGSVQGFGVDCWAIRAELHNRLRARAITVRVRGVMELRRGPRKKVSEWRFVPGSGTPDCLSLATILFLFIAGVLGGALNSVAGGGSFIAFPALLWTGVPPIPANATNTISLWSGQAASGGAYRSRLDVPRRVMIPLRSEEHTSELQSRQ